MGVKSSKVFTTNWEKADGHLHHYETLDHMAPFQHHETLVLSHDNQREFKVSLANDVMYTTKAVPKTAFWFDLCRADEPILQVRGHPWGTTWDIYSYHVPSFVGQEVVLDEHANHHPLYLKARVNLNWKQDGAKVQLCQATTENKAASLHWSDPILVYDNVNFVRGSGQTHLPKEDNLVSYFELSADHKPMSLELAKGCDVALHVILTVIANLIHANTNPFLAHASDGFMGPHAFMF